MDALRSDFARTSNSFRQVQPKSNAVTATTLQSNSSLFFTDDFHIQRGGPSFSPKAETKIPNVAAFDFCYESEGSSITIDGVAYPRTAAADVPNQITHFH